MIDERALAERWESMMGCLDERQRRLFAASEARAAGRGGLAAVSRVTGLAETTVRRGMRDLAAGESWERGRVRRPGAGRRSVLERDPGVQSALDGLLAPVTVGDPERVSVRWTSKSAVKLAEDLRALGHRVADRTVLRLLGGMGFSMQGNHKTREGADHPDRDAQFTYINDTVAGALAAGQPVISADTKKKELVGEFKNGGREWAKTGEPVEVNTHDFPSHAKGKATPYGVYDVGCNEGYVSVGISADTAAFAASSILAWWRHLGTQRYPDAEILTSEDDFRLERVLGSTEVLGVGPLELAEVDRVFRARLGAGLSRPTVAELHRVSGGNPFYALELARALLNQGRSRSAGEPLPVPDSMRDLLRARLDRLSLSARDVLLIASALSQPTTAVIERVLSRDAAREGLAAAVAADVLGLDGERVRFDHPLLASAVYTEAPEGRRRELHHQLASVVDDPQERARHLALGTPVPDAAVAASIDTAARAAAARGAHSVAAVLAERAHALTPASGVAAGSGRLVRSADYHLRDPGRARALLARAVSLAPDGPLRARAYHRLALVEYLAEGLRSAEQPFLSPKTVEAHVSRIFAKVGVRFRRELRSSPSWREPQGAND
jgi:DNA-binding NarL/FixJ family response regulator